jgi:hypothetical protein
MAVIRREVSAIVVTLETDPALDKAAGLVHGSGVLLLDSSGKTVLSRDVLNLVRQRTPSVTQCLFEGHAMTNDECHAALCGRQDSEGQTRDVPRPHCSLEHADNLPAH